MEKINYAVFADVCEAVVKYEDAVGETPRKVTFNTKYYEKTDSTVEKLLQAMGMKVEFADMPKHMRLVVGQDKQLGDFRLVF